MSEIGRSYDELDSKIKQTNSSLKSGENSLRCYDRALVKNSSDLSIIKQKYELLPNIIADLSNKTNILKSKQSQLNKDLASGSISQTNYNLQMASTTKTLDSVATKTAEYNKKLAQQNQEIRAAKFDNFISGAKSAEDATQKFSRTVTMGAAALVGFIAVGVKAGDDLDDIANKYQTTSEALQIQRNRYDKLTESNQGYENSLKAIGAIQTSIVAGRGAKYLTYLKELQMSQQDLNGKTNGEIYDIIFEKLQDVTDATDRARIAQGLFGDSGNNVALVAGTTTEELSKLDDAFIANGIITNEQAKIAGEYADKIADVKSKIMEFALFLLQKWDSLSPFVQGLLIFLLSTVVILPKIIGLIGGVAVAIKTIGIASVSSVPGVLALGVASGKILLILGLIAGAILAVTTLMGYLNKKTDDTTDSIKKQVDELKKSSEKIASAKLDMGYETSIVAESNSHRTVDMNINIDSRGDTQISRDNANIIGAAVAAQLDGEAVNQQWGRKIVGG